MTYAKHVMDALTGPEHGLRAAWLMALASYTYTRAHDGSVVSDEGDRIYFSRWYCFKGAAVIFWRYLWKREQP